MEPDPERIPILQPASASENAYNKKGISNDVENANRYDSFLRHPKTTDASCTVPSSGATLYQDGADGVKDKSYQPSPVLNGSGNNKTDPDVQVYKRRWYILAVFSLYSNVQTALWQTWGPISNSSERVFNWSDSTIAWLNNSGPMTYSVAGILFPWLLQVKGLRVAFFGSVLLTSVGSTFRVISDDPSTASILIHVGQFISAVSNPIAMGAIPYLSSTWFPVHERVTATAIASSVSFLGTAVSFVVGPALVSDSKVNSTHNLTDEGPSGIDNNTVLDDFISKEKNEIMHYMYYSCGVAWFITIIAIIYFPAKPPKPPSVSSVVQRDYFWRGICSLRKNRYFIFIAITYGMPVGVSSAWMTMLNIVLGKFGLSQSTAGWIGFYSTVASCLTGIAVGTFADCFTRMMKTFILIMYVLGAIFFITFTLMFIDVIPYNNILLWVTVIGGVAAVNGATPLLFELACEMAFPTGEGPTTGVLTYIGNMFALIFLVLFSIPYIRNSWMNWMVVASMVLSLPLMGFTKGKMVRLDFDEKETRQSAAMTD